MVENVSRMMSEKVLVKTVSILYIIYMIGADDQALYLKIRSTRYVMKERAKSLKFCPTHSL